MNNSPKTPPNNKTKAVKQSLANLPDNMIYLILNNIKQNNENRKQPPSLKIKRRKLERKGTQVRREELQKKRRRENNEDNKGKKPVARRLQF